MLQRIRQYLSNRRRERRQLITMALCVAILECDTDMEKYFQAELNKIKD